MHLGQRHIGVERTFGGGLPLDEAHGAAGELGVDFAARFEIEFLDDPGWLTLATFQDVLQLRHGRIVSWRLAVHRLVAGAGDAVPFVEATVVGVAARLVAQVPLAIEGGGVTLL